MLHVIIKKIAPLLTWLIRNSITPTWPNLYLSLLKDLLSFTKHLCDSTSPPELKGNVPVFSRIIEPTGGWTTLHLLLDQGLISRMHCSSWQKLMDEMKLRCQG